MADARGGGGGVGGGGALAAVASEAAEQPSAEAAAWAVAAQAVGGGGSFRGGGHGWRTALQRRRQGSADAGVAVGGPRVGRGPSRAVARATRAATGRAAEGMAVITNIITPRRFWPGVAIGAAIGSSYAYYGGPGYNDPDYYDDGYYDDSAVAVVPVEGGDEAYCRQTYRSWDPGVGNLSRL